jgi:predicted ATPase
MCIAQPQMNPKELSVQFTLAPQRPKWELLIKAYLDGWKLFGRKSIFIGDQTFKFESATGAIISLDLRFAPDDTPLPHDINVLIGPNGVGKSQLLHQIVRSWLQLSPSDSDIIGFIERPNLSQIVVVSYSPFELFPVDTRDDTNRRDYDVYRYFGLRGRKKTLTESRRGSSAVTLSREFPKANAAQSLLACLADDQKYGAIKDWSKKVKTMESVLRQAIDFDYAAVVVGTTVRIDDLVAPNRFLQNRYINKKTTDENGKLSTEIYIPIASDRINELKVPALKKYIKERSGVVFLKNGKTVHLSSGQRLFFYIVINILGAIRRNSLILIDEPELFLHPTLEISFVRMLKSILTNYGAKALIVTHSIVTVREVPRKCVHVLEKTKDGIVLKIPPFETFGGDVQRISSYVFGDKSLSKPYEDWLGEQLESFGSAKKLIAALGNNINEELIIQINAMERDSW